MRSSIGFVATDTIIETRSMVYVDFRVWEQHRTME